MDMNSCGVVLYLMAEEAMRWAGGRAGGGGQRAGLLAPVQDRPGTHTHRHPPPS